MRREVEKKADRIIELLLSLVPYTKVSHHEPGRITIQVSLSGWRLLQNRELEGLSELVPGILDTRTKLLSRSIEIDYDKEQLPYDLWESLLGLREEPDQAPIVRARLRDVLEHGPA